MTFAEQRASEEISGQTVEQLQKMLEQFSSTEYDNVEYFIIPQGKICYPVKLKVMEMFIMSELEYRGE